MCQKCFMHIFYFVIQTILYIFKGRDLVKFTMLIALWKTLSKTFFFLFKLGMSSGENKMIIHVIWYLWHSCLGPAVLPTVCSKGSTVNKANNTTELWKSFWSPGPPEKVWWSPASLSTSVQNWCSSTCVLNL